MSEAYYVVVGALWLVCLVFSMVSWLFALANRLPSVPLSRLLFNSVAAFDEANYTDRGLRYRTCFLIGWMCCALCTAALVLLGLAG